MAKILVIDDDDMMNDLLIQILSEEGYDVVGAETGSRGMRLFQSEPFDLIITDIIMPDQEGIETIRQIRAHNKEIPIIAISGGGRIGPGSYLGIAQKFGADYTFEKPFNHSSFLAAIRECLSDIQQ